MAAPVFLTTRMPRPALDLLQQRGIAFDFNDSNDAMPRAELLKAVVGRAGLVCLVLDRVDKQLLDAAGPSLKVVATVSVGFDHIDLAETRRRGIVVTNTPDVLSETTADLGFALLMATARRVVELDKFVRNHQWNRWSYFDFWGRDIHGATLGIIGGGRIGAAMARRGTGFNMRLLCHTRRGSSPLMPAGTEFVDMPTLLRESDYVSLHAPLTPQTRHMIGAAELAMMKPTAILINTARGAMIDEPALIETLKAGRIAGAGLDVFEREPHVPEELMRLDNVVLLPHTGSASQATRETMACLAAGSVADVLAGKTPQYVVK